MKKNILIIFVLFAISFSSCKKFLDINTNPNIAQTPTVQTLLPAAQLYIGSSVGCDLEITGSIWAQYWTQSPIASQYHILDQYTPGPDFFSTPWLNLYTGAENFYQLYKLADSQKRKQYMAISLLMQAYTFQLLTDGWEDVPFTQALKGQYTDGHVVNAVYDKQSLIYAGIINYIDSANKLINPNDPLKPGSDDLIYGGDMNKWQKFSNTLMLKILLRLSHIDPSTAQTGINKLLNNTSTNSFIGVGDDALIGYGYNSANKNPLYAEEAGLGSGIQNLVGSKTCIDSMNSNNDYRAYVFYEALSNGSVAGLPQGFYNNVQSGTYSIVSYNVAGDAGNANSTNAPVFFISSWESLFLQAEVAARGWGGATGDDSLYYAGIAASFNYPAFSNAMQSSPVLGVSGAVANYIYIHGDSTIPSAPGYWAVYPSTGTFAEKQRFIITQKWFSMCGNQGFEAWCEWRRTGFPDFFTFSKTTSIGNSFPKRLLYPTSESTTDANYPGQLPLTKQVWWGIN